MQAGEENGMRIVERFDHVLQKCVGDNRGEIIKSYGDGSLVLFDSAVDAVHCATAIQIDLNQDLYIPARIGIHIGEVVHKGDDVFGNGVNLASRVESMGVAGAVLLSKNAYQAVRNKEQITAQSLGNYEFKNVDEPMEVFALDVAGLVVPERHQIQGKFQEGGSGSKRRSWALAGVLGGLAVLLAALFIPKHESNSSPISDQDRVKRIAVLPFSNQTSSSDLEPYGMMISDWLTRGLMEAGEANIVNSSNFQLPLSPVNYPDGNPKLVSQTGIDIFIQGRYYLAEDELFVRSDIVDISNGVILHSETISGPRLGSMSILEELTEEIVGYWAVKDKLAIRTNPPNFAAYKEWIEGRRTYENDVTQAAILFENAFRADTTFFDPLFRLAGANNTLGKMNEVVDIIEFIKPRISRLSKYERLSFQSLEASIEGNYLLAARLNEQIVAMDPSEHKANYNAAYFYYQANHPAQTLKMLRGYDQRLAHDENKLVSWRSGLEAAALLSLGEHHEIIPLAENYTYPKMFTILGVINLKALVHLDSMERLAQTYKQYRNEGIIGPTGHPDFADNLLLNICNELLLLGNESGLVTYAEELQDWLSQDGAVTFDHSAPDVFNNRPIRQKEGEGFVNFYLGKYREALDDWSNEIIPSSNWPDVIDRASRVGVCHAILKDSAQANEAIQLIKEIRNENPYLKSNQFYFQSRIHAALGNLDEAVSLIERSIAEGLVLLRPYILRNDPFLIDLHDYPAFEELVAPNG